MSTTPRPNTHHIAIGFCILGLGLVLILDRLGIVAGADALRYWPLALVVVGLSVIVQAVRPDAPVVNSTVPWGSIVWILILGFSLSHVFERQSEAAETSDPAQAIFAVLTGADRTAGPEFRNGRITTLLGGAKLDLRTARPAPGEDVVVDVFTLMGGAVLLAPPEWHLDVRATSVMGGIADERQEDQRRQEEAQRRARRRNAGVGVFPSPSDDAGTDVDTADREDVGTPVEARDAGETTPDGRPTTGAAEPGPTAAPPRLVVRGFVGMGGLAIKAR